ncbi:MAG: Elongation factor P [Chlamydiia bacterium]|nr:Elongation factor P [Chlamydiia bacterium]
MGEKIDINSLRGGSKILVDNNPYRIQSVDLVKPGKGQAFARVKIKNLYHGKVIEKTFKSNEKIELADVQESKMRFLYKDGEDAVFMDDNTYDQVNVIKEVLGDNSVWLKEDELYEIVFFNNEVIDITPPNFLELKIVESAPGVRGDTASGNVLKPALMETGAKVNVPIFIEEGEVIKVDTRTGDYVSRAGK